MTLGLFSAEFAGGTVDTANQLIIDFAKRNSVDLKLINPKRVSFYFAPGIVNAYHDGVTLEIDGLLIRSTRGYEEVAYTLASVLEKQQKRVVDPASSLVGSRGKLTYQYQRIDGTHFTPSYFGIAPDVEHFSTILSQQDLDYPLIVKSQHGFGGKDVWLVDSLKQYKELRDSIGDASVIIQKKLDIISEFRVMVVNGRSLGSVRKEGEGIAKNAAQGSTFVSVDDPEVEAFAVEAAQSHTGIVQGIDVARTSDDQLYVIEANRTPNFTAFREATGIPVEEHIINLFS